MSLAQLLVATSSGALTLSGFTSAEDMAPPVLRVAGEDGAQWLVELERLEGGELRLARVPAGQVQLVQPDPGMLQPSSWAVLASTSLAAGAHARLQP